jgi:hypothetical protein
MNDCACVNCVPGGVQYEAHLVTCMARSKRLASSHGSTFARANTDTTLSDIPLASLQTGANRKASYRGVSVGTDGRWVTVTPFLIVAKTCGVSCRPSPALCHGQLAEMPRLRGVIST